MATYAIGDIQGCFEPFMRLLQRVRFRRGTDRLWLVGDVVNRGPASLDVLRWLVAHDADVVAVLGNHDLHLLAQAEGVARRRADDTLDAVLDAPDRDALLGWLRHRPLLHHEDGHLLVHAGLLPRWSPKRALKLARDVEARLRGPRRRAFIEALYSDHPRAWRDDLSRRQRALLATAVMTRIRAVDAAGDMSRGYKGTPELMPADLTPWFSAPGRRSAEVTVVFGHWASLGLWVDRRLIATDSGCVWGGALTAVRLEDRAVFSVPALRP